MEVGGFKDIIGAINTPLALAALAILVIGSILYAGAQKGGRERPMLTRYGFGLAALFGILAIAGFIFDSAMNQIFLVRGSIADERGNNIEGAVIDIVGFGRSASLADGQFSVPVFRKDTRPTYEVRARKTGYEDWSGQITGPVPDFIPITTKALVFREEHVRPERDGGVGVFLGVPEVMVGFRGRNDTTRQEVVRTINLRLTSPGGKSVTLYPYSMIDSSGISRPVSLLTFPPLEEVSQQITWVDRAAIDNAVMAINTSGPPMGPNGCIPTMDDDWSNPRLEQFFDQNFIWEPGLWKARLAFTTDRLSVVKTFSFELSQSDSDSLRETRTAYKQCRGLFYGNHSVSNGSARSYIQVSNEITQ